ncbi:MAG: hypothetical protein MUC88_01455 [Planctomycetes bacterium]|jgi:hypothetical protein|nr:hypothetical protein [Planctomycetota bacterium]
MRHTRARLLSGAMVWLTLAGAPLVCASGQNAAQPPPAGVQVRPEIEGLPEVAVPETIGSPGPAVTLERQGRRLILNCPAARRDSLPVVGGPREEPPRFAIYQGQRQLASGQFEYG